MTNDFFEKEQKHYVSIFLKAHCLNEHELQNLEPDKVESWHVIYIKKLLINPIYLILNIRMRICVKH